MRRFALGIMTMLLLAALTRPAAASAISYLDIISDDDIGKGILGSVALTQNGANEVDVSVSLAAKTKFVSTGHHDAFAFNLDLDRRYSVEIDGPKGLFSLVTKKNHDDHSPYGSFTVAIDCPGCGPGASHAHTSVLNFAVMASGITVDDFVANTKGYYFLADVLGPLGQTGNIAANQISAVPLPPALPLFGASVGGLWLIGRHRRREERGASSAHPRV